MVKYTLGLALLASALALALCPSANAQLPPSWLSDAATNSYEWIGWTAMGAENPCTVAPDLTQGTGSATATVTIAHAGAGLISGMPIGSVDSYIDLGPGGTIHLDLAPDTGGQYVYVQVAYHTGMVFAPTVTAANATALAGRRSLLEDTSLDPELPSGWMLGEYLWKVDAADVEQFSGVDIVADSTMGSIVEYVTAHTHCVPEPAGLLVIASGAIALAGFVRRRRA